MLLLLGFSIDFVKGLVKVVMGVFIFFGVLFFGVWFCDGWGVIEENVLEDCEDELDSFWSLGYGFLGVWDCVCICW